MAASAPASSPAGRGGSARRCSTVAPIAGGRGPGFFAGRSWGFCRSVLDSGAYGWDGGLGSSWLVDPNYDLAVIVLTQRMFESPEAPNVHRDIQAAAYAALAGRSSPAGR